MLVDVVQAQPDSATITEAFGACVSDTGVDFACIQGAITDLNLDLSVLAGLASCAGTDLANIDIEGTTACVQEKLAGMGSGGMGGDEDPGMGSGGMGGDEDPGMGSGGMGGDEDPGMGSGGMGGDEDPGMGSGGMGGDEDPGMGSGGMGEDEDKGMTETEAEADCAACEACTP